MTHRAVLGALVRDGRVLVVHRSPAKRAYPDVWDLPGGVVDTGETDLDALVRELHEELGVRIAAESVRPLCTLTLDTQDGPVLLSAWLVGVWSGTPANLAPDEHDDWGWFGVDEMPALVHPPVHAAVVEALISGGPLRS